MLTGFARLVGGQLRGAPWAAAKKMVRLVAEQPLSAAFEEAERIWEPVYTSQDAQEGPAAFRDKRTPEWKGR